MPGRSLLVLFVLLIGVLAVSTAALLVRLADAPGLSTAALRMVFAAAPALALLPLRGRSEVRRFGSGDRVRLLLAGCCLALHFATWIPSLELTTVSSSVALVTTSPVFVAAFLLATGQRIPAGMLLAMLVCLAGGLLIGFADLLRGGSALAGDGLALAGAAFAAAYFALGKEVRPRASLATYIGVVYPVAAVVLVALALVARQPLRGFDARTWLMFALLAAVPQLLGHSALNWALGYLSAPAVTIAVLGEPVIATLLAAVFLQELPGPARVAGGVVVLCGVYLGLRAELGGARPALTADRRAGEPLPVPPSA